MKNIAFFLLFFLLASGHSNANAVGGSIGGWNVVSNVASGIGAKITATKEVMVNGTSKVVTGTANIMPDPSNMGKFMARLGGAAVLSEVVNQLLDGVDWVLDPVNNQIVYTPKENPDLPYLSMVWAWAKIIGSSPNNVCNQILSYDKSQYPSYESVKTRLTINSTTTATCYLYNINDRMTNLYTEVVPLV